MDRPFTTKWLEKNEKLLWDLCDSHVCEKTEEAKTLSQQCREYVAVLKDDREWYRMCCSGMQRRVDTVLEGKEDPELERLKTEVKAQGQIIYNTRMDYAEVVKNLEGPANVHAELVEKLQEKIIELEKTAGVTNARLEKCIKEQEQIRNELEKLQGNTSKFQKEKQNQELRQLQLELDNLQQSLGSKDTEIVVLKRKLEQTEKDLENAKSDVEKEGVLFKGIRDVITKALDKFVLSDLSDPPTEVSCNEDIVKKIHFTFVQYVVPPNVLHYFHKYDTKILAMGDIERVRSESESHGNMCGAGILLDRLRRYKDWFPCLLKVLRDPEVKMEHVADKMEALIAPKSQVSGLTVNSPQYPGSHEIVFAREGYDLEDMKSRCRNKEHHDKFIPVDEFRDGCLRDRIDHSRVETMLKNAFDLVVRIDITQMNASNPKTSSGNTGFRQIGSGMVWDMYKSFTDSTVPCSCHDCKESPEPKKEWAEFVVLTAMGLMQYDPKCRLTVCRLSYKDVNGKPVDSVLKPVKIKNQQENDDLGYCELSCVTHDQTLAERLAKKVEKYRRSRSDAKGKKAPGSSERCAVISYPHGLDKRVSLGKLLESDTNKSVNPKEEVYDAVTCEGCCGAPVFFFEKGVFTGQTVHDGKNKTGNNQSIEYRDTGRFY